MLEDISAICWYHLLRQSLKLNNKLWGGSPPFDHEVTTSQGWDRFLSEGISTVLKFSMGVIIFYGG